MSAAGACPHLPTTYLASLPVSGGHWYTSSNDRCRSTWSSFRWHGSLWCQQCAQHTSAVVQYQTVRPGWIPTPSLKAGGFSGDYNKNRTLNHTPRLWDAKCLYSVGAWKFAWLGVSALLCRSGILGMAVSEAQSSHRDESEKKMHSFLFLYYPTQGHTDVMKPSFCYLEWAAHLPILSAKWVSRKFYMHNHNGCTL